MKTKKIIKAALLFVFMLVFFSVTVFGYQESSEEKKDVDAAREIMEEFSDIIPNEAGVSLDEDELLENVGFDAILRAVEKQGGYHKAPLP